MILNAISRQSMRVTTTQYAINICGRSFRYVIIIVVVNAQSSFQDQKAGEVNRQSQRPHQTVTIARFIIFKKIPPERSRSTSTSSKRIILGIPDARRRSCAIRLLVNATFELRSVASAPVVGEIFSNRTLAISQMWGV